MTSLQKDYFFIDALDLSDDQIATTQETYLEYADKYVSSFERVDGALEKTRPFTIDPFLNYYQKLKLTHPVLFAGCGSGRDLEFTSKQGIATIGLDISQPMLNIARKMGIESPLEVMDIKNISFAKNSFDGIFCETALSHIKKTDLGTVIGNFFRMSRPKGIALLGFRLGDGRVYYTNDSIGGVRYNTTITKKEIEDIVTREGFEVLETNICKHQISDRPPFYNLIIQKPS